MRLIDADKLIYQSHAQHLEPYINKKDIDNAPTVEMAEDCISREETLNKINALIAEYIPLMPIGWTLPLNIAKTIYELPSVTPQPKRGHWIKVTNGRGGHECDLCHEYAPSYQSGDEYLTKYCPNCGADMREVQDGV